MKRWLLRFWRTRQGVRVASVPPQILPPAPAPALPLLTHQDGKHYITQEQYIERITEVIGRIFVLVDSLPAKRWAKSGSYYMGVVSTPSDDCLLVAQIKYPHIRNTGHSHFVPVRVYALDAHSRQVSDLACKVQSRTNGTVAPSAIRAAFKEHEAAVALMTNLKALRLLACHLQRSTRT